MSCIHNCEGHSLIDFTSEVHERLTRRTKTSISVTKCPLTFSLRRNRGNKGSRYSTRQRGKLSSPKPNIKIIRSQTQTLKLQAGGLRLEWRDALPRLLESSMHLVWCILRHKWLLNPNLSFICPGTISLLYYLFIEHSLSRQIKAN